MEKLNITEQTTREELVAALTAAYAEIDNLNAKVEALNKEAESHKDELSNAASVIDELKAKIKDAPISESDLGIVKCGNKQYKITVPRFNYNDKEYTAKELQLNADLVKELVEMGFGGLVELRDRKKSS